MHPIHSCIAVTGLALTLAINSAHASCPTWHALSNGNTADAGQVMDNFNVILGCPNFIGNVGVGIGTPSTKLEVYGAEILDSDVGNNEFALDSSGANYGFLSNRGIGIWSLGYGPTLGVLGTAVLTWSSSGNVGIGDTAPAAKLSVLTNNDTTPASITAFDGRHFVVGAGASAGGVALSYNQTSHIAYISAARPNVAWDSLYLNASDFQLQTAGIARVTLSSSGNVGVGTTSPAYALDVAGTIRASTYVVAQSDIIAYGNLQVRGTSAIYYNTSIDAYSAIRNSASTGQSNLVLSTGGADRVTVANSGSVRFNTYGAGTLTTDSSGNITASSDARFKHLDGVFSPGLEAVLRLKPVLYHWNAKSGLDQTTQYAGFIAQDVLPVIPQAVGHAPDGSLTLSDRPIEAALVNAVTQLKALEDRRVAEIDTLKAKLDVATTESARLEARLSKLDETNSGLAAAVRAQAETLRKMQAQMGQALRRPHVRTAQN